MLRLIGDVVVVVAWTLPNRSSTRGGVVGAGGWTWMDDGRECVCVDGPASFPLPLSWRWSDEVERGLRRVGDGDVFCTSAGAGGEMGLGGGAGAGAGAGPPTEDRRESC